MATNAPALALDDITCRFAGRDGGEAYTAVAVVFFVCLWPLVQLTYWMERRLGRSE